MTNASTKSPPASLKDIHEGFDGKKGVAAGKGLTPSGRKKGRKK